MSNVVIPYAADRARAVANRPVALDANGNPQAFTGTISIDDYTTAYAANGGSQIFVVVKTIPAAGQTKTVNLTIQAFDADNNPLPPVTQGFDIQGPPPPPLATHLQTPLSWSTTSGPLYAPPADPGSASIPL